MQYKIFLSYSWKDMPIAMRLYNDLIHSQVSIWRDQIDGDPIADFKDEFLKKIDECEYFLMLDSVNYRQKSNWCCTEVKRCFEKKKKIIVCLLQPDGEWRTQYKDAICEKYFSKINMYKYHNLYFKDYDNDGIYYKTISFICSLCQTEYKAWNQLPTIQDLLDELSYKSINDGDRKMILYEYDVITHLIEEDRCNIKKHFYLWIDDCEKCNIDLFFPRWTFAVWLALDKHNNRYDRECFNQFEKLSLMYPNEPRVYRGLGCIAAKIGNYEYAYEQLCIANRLLSSIDFERHKRFNGFEVLFNLGQVCLNMLRYNDALFYFREAEKMMKSNNFCNISLLLNIDICMRSLEYSVIDRIYYLEQCTKIYSCDPELLQALGLCYTENGANINALDAFTKSYDLQPSIKTLFFILCRKKILNMSVSIAEIEEKLKIKNNTPEDFYYEGAIWFYIIGDIDKAYRCYSFCKNSYYEWYN